MAIEKKIGLYELLFRFEDGQFKGAHSISTETVWDTETGQVYAQNLLDARAVTTEEAARMIGAEAASLVQQAAEATAAHDRMAAAMADLQAQADALKDQNADLTDKLQTIGRDNETARWLVEETRETLRAERQAAQEREAGLSDAGKAAVRRIAELEALLAEVTASADPR